MIGAAGCVEGGCGGRVWRPCPSPSVIVTQVRIQGCGALSCLALDPDFRQDDGIGVGCGVIGAAGCLESVAAGLAALPFPVRHPDESQDPGLRGAVLLGSGS